MNVGILLRKCRNYVALPFNRFTGERIEEEFVVEVGMEEVEQVVQLAGKCIG